MLFEKKYYDKEMECRFCHTKSKPIIEKNNINFGLGSWPGTIGRIGSGAGKDKKYILICPNRKAIIGTK